MMFVGQRVSTVGMRLTLHMASSVSISILLEKSENRISVHLRTIQERLILNPLRIIFLILIFQYSDPRMAYKKYLSKVLHKNARNRIISICCVLWDSVLAISHLTLKFLLKEVLRSRQWDIFFSLESDSKGTYVKVSFQSYHTCYWNYHDGFCGPVIY